MKRNLQPSMLLAAMVPAVALCASAGETALDRYIAKPDPAYQYTHRLSVPGFGINTYFIDLVSQTWRSGQEVDRTLWEHNVEIAAPWAAWFAGRRTALLVVEGGSNGRTPPTEPEPLLSLAATILGIPVVYLQQVPNQPLVFADDGGRRRSEDAILAYSLDKYLNTLDEEWPVHLAMTKAAVRCMDVAQEVLNTQGLPIDDFIVVGGSKRGWTTWLTAAVDSRVKAILPASIDILNLIEQVQRHWEAYGFYAPAIHDYADLDVFCQAMGPNGEALSEIIDPHRYRDRYTMRKLLLNSAGDQFFLPDSSNRYYADLAQPKLMRYSFNTDHSQINLSVIFGAVAWVRSVLRDDPQPAFAWWTDPRGWIVLFSPTPPTSVRLWSATNPDARDFRLESLGPAWGSLPLPAIAPGIYIAHRPAPSAGWTAFAVEMRYGSGLFDTQTFTSDVVIVPDVFPFEGTHCAE